VSGSDTTRRSDARALPSVDRLVGRLVAGRPGEPRSILTDVARSVLAAARSKVLAGEAAPSVDELVEAAERQLASRARLSPRPLVNATGVILHTNLGRAPLSDAAMRAIAETAPAYSDLEFDLDSGERGSRAAHVSALIAQVTGAEAGLAVNNNAGATLLCLTALAAGREVIVSRGQAVEIGGGFRIPDVMLQSGSILIEVGTTNRTYARDYEDAVTTATAALLHVHSSNFRVVGFTREVPLAEMSEVARRHGLTLLDDNGSGALLDTAAFGLPHEPTVQESVAAGSDVVCFSGDKLLGGPQAGIVCGRGELVSKIARHPLARALRIDKLSLAALAATLRHYARGEAREQVPVWRMMAAPGTELEARARRWAGALSSAGVGVELVEAESAVGGGSLPGATLPTVCLAIAPDPHNKDGDSATWLSAALRGSDPPIVARVERGKVLLDPRTVLPEQDGYVERVLSALASRLAAARR